MNKTIISVILIFFAGLAAFQSVNAAPAPEYGYQIEVTNTSFLPPTIYPGDTIILEVDIKNRSSETQLIDIEAEIDLGDQFKEIKASDSIRDLISSETKTLAFEFQARIGTSSGYYSMPLTITYLSDSDLLKQTHIVFVPVSEIEKNLDIIIEPNVVNPGKPTEVVFTIKNVGGTPVSNISLSWTEENNLVLPLGSDNTRYINILTANQEAKVSYLVAADPNITPGIYPLDISISFNDLNATRTQTSHIGLIIGGTTEFEISAEMLATGQLSISIANIGSNNAGAVVVSIPDQPGVTISGSDTSILGNLNKGDYTLATFEMRMTSNQERHPQTQSRPSELSTNRGTLQIEIDYTDTTGERQSIQKELELNTVFSETGTEGTQTGFAGRMGRQQASTFSYVAWALLGLILVGAVVYNKLKTRKSWKRLGKVLAIITAIFLVVIFGLNSNMIALAIATIISVALLGWSFREKHMMQILDKTVKIIEKE